MAEFKEYLISHELVVKDKIDPKFIEDFALTFGIKEQYPIDFERAIQWIGFTRKDSAKRNLTKTFAMDIDYCLHPRVDTPGGTPEELISLTVDCFKQMAMLAKTEAGKQVRLYYLTLEKIFIDYMQKQKEASDKRAAELEAQNLALKDKLANNYYESREKIYIIKNDLYNQDGIYKIGRTKDMNKRIGPYNTANKEPVEVIYERNCIDSKLTESVIKFILTGFEYETNKEYYKVNILNAKTIIDEVVDSIDNLRRRFVDLESGKEVIEYPKVHKVLRGQDLIRTYITKDEYESFINTYLEPAPGEELTRVRLTQQIKLTDLFQRSVQIGLQLTNLISDCITYMNAHERGHCIVGWKIKEPPIEEFVNSECDVADDLKSPTIMLFELYKTYCARKKFLFTSDKRFKALMNAAGYEWHAVKNQHYVLKLTPKRGQLNEFLELKYETDPTTELKSSIVFDEYRKWCTEHNLYTFDRNTFNAKMELLGYPSVLRNNGTRWFQGIKAR